MAHRDSRRVDRRRFLRTTAAGTTLGLAGCSGILGGSDEEFPSESVTIVVPFAEGGGTDGYARIIQDPLSDELGVDVTINNIPGSGWQATLDWWDRRSSSRTGSPQR